MKKYEIVYSAKDKLGYFQEDKYIGYTAEEQEQILQKLEKEIQAKDQKRRVATLSIGTLLLVVTLVLVVLNITPILNIDWFTFSFVFLIAVLLWVLLYYLVGLIAYQRIYITWHLKNQSSKNPNRCVNYASSDYGKWVDSYLKYMGSVSFIKNTNKGKNTLINFCLYKPKSFKNAIYNGYIQSNIFYYYLSYEDKKLCFMPGFIIYLDKKESKVFAYKQFHFTIENNVYTLYIDQTVLLQFLSQNTFNPNFFHFKY